MLGSVLVKNISNISLDNLVIIKSDFHLRWFYGYREYIAFHHFYMETAMSGHFP